MPNQPERRLYKPDELTALLQLSQEQIDRLIKTDQIRTIRICGEVRIVSNELDALIETYKQIAQRKHYAEVLQ